MPDDDFMVVEALQQQIASDQAIRTKDLEGINDKLKGKKSDRSELWWDEFAQLNLQHCCELWKRRRYLAADRRRWLRQADMRE